MATGADIVATAREYLGVRFAHQGRDTRTGPDSTGLDCIGLAFVSAWRNGIFGGWDFKAYRRTPDGTLPRELAARLLAVSPGEERAGDLLLFRIKREPQHVGLLATDRGPEPYVIHARPEGVCEHRLAEEWAARVIGIYRLPGLTA